MGIKSLFVSIKREKGKGKASNRKVDKNGFKVAKKGLNDKGISVVVV